MRKGFFFMTIIMISLIAIPAFAAPPVKIIVAATEKTSGALVSEQAGSAAYFLIFDKKGKLLEAVENPYRNADSPGPSVINYLASKGAKTVIAGGFGPKIVEIMKAKGITPVSFKGNAQDAVKKVLDPNR